MGLRVDWLPVSAALLLTGALALALGTILLPSSDGTAETLRVVQERGGVWMAAAAVYFLASVCLTLGLPSMLALFEDQGRSLGLISMVVLEIGFIGTAGYAMLMVFFRALVDTHTLADRNLDDLAQDTGLMIFLYAWILGFVVGEVLLALALLRARAVARWVPFVLILHVVAVLLAAVLPDWFGKASILLFVAGVAGIAIQVTSPAVRRRLG